VSAPDQERELEALLALSRRSRAKLDRLREVLISPGHYGKGATPSAVVYRENKLRLLRLVNASGEPFTGPPVLFVPAPVSRYFILDLLPGRSFAAHIANAGFDVFVIDFGEPSSEDRFADLEHYVEGLIRRCVRKVLAIAKQPRLNLVGYCLGGTLSLLYTALHPDSVARLVLLTTMVDGDVRGGIAWVAHRMGLEGESYENPRLVPAAEVKSWRPAATARSAACRISGTASTIRRNGCATYEPWRRGWTT
jgi:pimeloyl-ACP methyl ester carboxylesterase